MLLENHGYAIGLVQIAMSSDNTPPACLESRCVRPRWEDIGGCAANEPVKCWGEVFDTKTQTWEPLPDPGNELRFSRVIRKIQIIQGKIYVRSNEEKDSVYDPKNVNETLQQKHSWAIVGVR
ncbi:Kelch repeat type 1 protein [Raphanus sativus]|nr:Kelch repeat type 1 protein [Raphanus sativus]